jgi:Transposase DDE domain
VPVVPSCLLEPVWVEFCALLGRERPGFDPSHPLGCHRRRVPDRVVFEHVVAALVHGSGYERIATPGCSDRTIRRRLKAWAALGIGEQVHALALAAYDQMIGLELANVAVDGCMTKAPCGGECAGPSTVDRRKGGLKRSVATEDYGVPLGIACAGANRHDSPLLAPTLQAAANQLGGVLPDQRACHLDAGYDSSPTRQTPVRPGLYQPDRPQGSPRAHPGRTALARRANPLLDERLRQALPDDRPRRHHRRLLPLPRRRVRHRTRTHPARLPPLPLGHPANHQTAQMTHLLPGALSPVTRREERAICTAAVPTVCTYGDTAPPYGPELVRRSAHQNQ